MPFCPEDSGFTYQFFFWCLSLTYNGCSLYLVTETGEGTCTCVLEVKVITHISNIASDVPDESILDHDMKKYVHLLTDLFILECFYAG